MNIFKLAFKACTQSGRRDIAREYIKPYASVDFISGAIADGVTWLLSKVDDKDALGKVAGWIERGAKLLTTVAFAIEDGKVTKGETDAIIAGAHTLTGEIVTQERIDSLVDACVKKIM